MLLLVIIGFGLLQGKKKKKQDSDKQECTGLPECEKITNDAFAMVCDKIKEMNICVVVAVI